MFCFFCVRGVGPCVRSGMATTGGLSAAEPRGSEVVTSQLVWRWGWWHSQGSWATGTVSHSSHCPTRPATWTGASTHTLVCCVGAGLARGGGLGWVCVWPRPPRPPHPPHPAATRTPGLFPCTECPRAAPSPARAGRREGLGPSLGLPSAVMGGAVPCPLGTRTPQPRARMTAPGATHVAALGWASEAQALKPEHRLRERKCCPSALCRWRHLGTRTAAGPGAQPGAGRGGALSPSPCTHPAACPPSRGPAPTPASGAEVWHLEPVTCSDGKASVSPGLKQRGGGVIEKALHFFD